MHVFSNNIILYYEKKFVVSIIMFRILSNIIYLDARQRFVYDLIRITSIGVFSYRPAGLLIIVIHNCSGCYAPPSTFWYWIPYSVRISLSIAPSSVKDSNSLTRKHFFLEFISMTPRIQKSHILALSDDLCTAATVDKHLGIIFIHIYLMFCRVQTICSLLVKFKEILKIIIF